MLVLFMTVTGVVSFLQLGVDLFPRSDAATVFVRVQLPGASPEEVTSQVVMPLEEAIASVSGIDEMRARVSEGSGSVIVTFALDRDIGEATEDVREKVAGAVRNFPQNARPPIVQKSDPDNEPIITIAISGQRSVRDLTEIADKQIRRALETVDGVAAVDISGARNRQINAFLDLDKLNAYNLTAQDVERALQTENIEAPGGRIVRGPNEVGVRTIGRLTSVADFNDIIIKNVGGAPIRVRDIGRVEDGMTEKRSFAYVDQTPAVIMEVRRQMGTNTVKVVGGIQERIARLRHEIPAGVKMDVLREQATFIESSVEALEEHLILGAIFASFIVWLFIREWRAVFISSLAIPTSIITSFHADASHGFHAELHDPARADAGGRHRDRRRDHRARKHLPLHRGEGRQAHGGGDPRDAGNRAGGVRHHALPGHHLRAHRFHDRIRQALSQPVRLDDGVLDHGFDAGRLHAHAHVERAPAQEAQQRQRPCPTARIGADSSIEVTSAC